MSFMIYNILSDENQKTTDAENAGRSDILLPESGLPEFASLLLIIIF